MIGAGAPRLLCDIRIGCGTILLYPSYIRLNNTGTKLQVPKRRCNHASLVAVLRIVHRSRQLYFLWSDGRHELAGSKIPLAPWLSSLARGTGHAQGADEISQDKYYFRQVSGSRLPFPWRATQDRRRL